MLFPQSTTYVSGCVVLFCFKPTHPRTNEEIFTGRLRNKQQISIMSTASTSSDAPRLNPSGGFVGRTIDGVANRMHKLSDVVSHTSHKLEKNKVLTNKYVSLVIVALTLVYSFYNSHKFATLDWAFVCLTVAIECYSVYLAYSMYTSAATATHKSS